MMTQPSAIAPDKQTIAQAELEQYIGKQADRLAPPGQFPTLEVATQNILSYANFMATEKTRDKTEFKKRLFDLGWKGEEKKYFKLAAAFKKFSPQDLAQVEPATLFRLANNPKKYQPVIDSMLDLPEITQAAVRDLIEQQRQPREPKPDEPTIWRQTRDGRRYCQIPPIHEENQQTGMTLQKMMDSEGLSAQRIVAEAISLRQAFIEGRLVLVQANPNSSDEPDSASADDTWDTSDRHWEDAPTVQLVWDDEHLNSAIDTLDNSAPELLAVPDAMQQSELLEAIARPINEENREERFYENEELTPGTWAFELELELDNSLNLPFVVTQLEMDEQSSQEVSQVLLLIETLQKADCWQEISQALEVHREYKQQAWDTLTPLEKRRVMEIMPEAIKKLSSAKKAGIVVDFREVRPDVYQVQRQGCLFWEVVILSRLDTFLAQL